MKPTESSYAEPQSRGEFPEGQASRLPSTPGRDGSPQPSEESPTSQASRRFAPTFSPLRASAPPRESFSPSAPGRAAAPTPGSPLQAPHFFPISDLQGPARSASPLRDAVTRLAEAYQPEAIWLFGSQARGDAGQDSDFDLLLIVPDDADRQHRKSELAYRVLRSLGRAFDVTVWRHSSFQEQSRSATSLPATILREGVLVYAA